MSHPEKGRPSKTSVYVAAGRAIGAREPDPSVRNPDSLAERLLGSPAGLGVDHPAVHALGQDYAKAIQDKEVLGSVIMMMIRTRFIDDCLRRAIEAGATQVVILGAGFDTRAYRLTDLLKDTTIFEVDRPQTQEVKKRRVAEALGGAPPNVAYVPIDFQHDNLGEVLARHGHDPACRTCFIWEGVTMYLPAAAVRATLEFVGPHASGSTKRRSLRFGDESPFQSPSFPGTAPTRASKCPPFRERSRSHPYWVTVDIVDLWTGRRYHRRL